MKSEGKKGPGKPKPSCDLLIDCFRIGEMKPKGRIQGKILTFRSAKQTLL